MTKAQPYLKYFFVFTLGTLCGGAIMFYVGWSVMTSLMGAQAQAKSQAMNATMDAYWQTQILSHLRLGEVNPAIERAEWLLDSKVLEADSATQVAQDAATSKFERNQLGAIKLYREMYPSNTDFKVPIGSVLSKIPNLPKPKPETANSNLTAVFRLYRAKK
jgi:hypothetical protein